MAKINKHIEIVSSSNRRLSSMSKKSYEMIEASLKKSFKTVGVSLVENLDDLENLARKNQI
jgi:hypothetical protein